MRIAFVGNQDNVNYLLCCWARQLGESADLYSIQWDRSLRSQPELVDSKMGQEQERPDWLRTYDSGGAFWFLRAKGKANQIERDYDVVVTAGATGLIVAPHFRKIPVVHITIGSEVSDFSMRLFRWSTGPLWRGVSWLCRKGLRRARIILTAGYLPEMNALRSLGMSGKVRLWFAPADVAGNLQRIDPAFQQQLQTKYGSFDKVFVWLSRLNYIDSGAHTYKGPDRFLEAFEKVVRQGRWNVRAIVGRHGLDAEAFVQLAHRKGLDGYIDYVPHLAFKELLAYVSMKNAVVFDYITPTGGGIYGLARESLSVGALLVKAVDRETISQMCGGDCPIIDAHDVESCHQAMMFLLEASPEKFLDIRKQYWDWARKNIHYEALMKPFLRYLHEAAVYPRGEGD